LKEETKLSLIFSRDLAVTNLDLKIGIPTKEVKKFLFNICIKQWLETIFIGNFNTNKHLYWKLFTELAGGTIITLWVVWLSMLYWQ